MCFFLHGVSVFQVYVYPSVRGFYILSICFSFYPGFLYFKYIFFFLYEVSVFRYIFISSYGVSIL